MLLVKVHGVPQQWIKSLHCQGCIEQQTNNLSLSHTTTEDSQKTMGKKSRRVRKVAEWSDPATPVPRGGEKYATVDLYRARDVPETHADAAGKHLMDSLSPTDKIMAKFYIQQHVPDDQFGRASPLFHRLIAATFCGSAPVRPTASHVNGTHLPTYAAFDKGGFVRHIDGNPANNWAANIAWVTLEDAMANFDSWVTDYDILLDEDEKRLVADPAWRNGLVFE